MADPEHILIAKQGSSEITRWQTEAGAGEVFDLRGANLEGVTFHGADLLKVDFRGANLRGARIFNCDAAFANFEGACLASASLALSKLLSANFSKANLTNAEFTSADLTVARFVDADLTGARLTCATFDRNEVGGACFKDALFDGTFLLNIDLSEARELDRIQSYAPSTIGIDTLYRSKGKIPIEFLRRCRVPKTLLSVLPSLFSDPAEFFSCFISYTEADDALSKKLYTDLTNEGIRCWRWREDAKWGRALISEVDQGIREYDKLVVILSAASLVSEPVIREIERALQRESRERKEVLFPILVDNSVFSWSHALQADLVRKTLGEFCNWEKPRFYKASLGRLIKALEIPS